MDHESYKELHENAMRNNNGTSIAEAFITIVPQFFITFLTVNLHTVLVHPLAIPATFLLEFISLIIPTILHVTVLNEKIWQIFTAIGFVVGTMATKQIYHRIHLAPFIQIPTKRPEYLSAVRAVINLGTAICILAVDFQCFPRKLAKTETFGFGLMDLGVGLYVYTNGIVLPFGKQIQRPFVQHLKSELLKSFPLCALGLARCFIIKEIDYQQHTSEYGVHWNFFLTLAITRFLGAIILNGMVRVLAHTKYISITILMLHEMALQIGLAGYVVDESMQRDTILRANREGIISISGYVALYLASVYIGSLLHINNNNDNNENNNDAVQMNARIVLRNAAKLGFISAILWKIVYVCADMFGVSRRLANMGYVIWTLSVGTTLTTLFMLLEIFYYFIAFEKPQRHNELTMQHRSGDASNYLPLILSAINYNGLAFFVIANLLTGAINMTFQTMLVSASGCVFLVTIYMFVLLSIITFFYINQIQLKI